MEVDGPAPSGGVAAQTADGVDAPARDELAEPPSGAASDDDLVGKLERLRALRADGTLDDDEFAAAKARLLG